MKSFGAIILILLPVTAFAASGPTPLGNNGGKFGDWTAASLGNVCYAFTSTLHESDGATLLTVTERPGTRDEVTLTAPAPYATGATVKLTIGEQNVDFYTQDSTAFTHMGATAVAALQSSNSAEIFAYSRRHHKLIKHVREYFPLRGFAGAYAAITAACP